MPPEGSVSEWIALLRDGDRRAAAPLWERYFRRLVELARAQLQGVPRRAADEEDVALSAFDSFCQGAERGRFPDLRDRDNLWRLLVVLTARKAAHLKRDAGRRKRGGGAGPGTLSAAGHEEADIEQVICREPTPEFAAQVAEECRRLLDRLGDHELQAVALWKMEGYTNGEIAGRLACGLRSVGRKLRVIRGVWEQETGHERALGEGH
jgi:DNA-directed RNA polymerase specialized sigma24 family protein